MSNICENCKKDFTPNEKCIHCQACKRWYCSKSECWIDFDDECWPTDSLEHAAKSNRFYVCERDKVTGAFIVPGCDACIY